MSLKHGILGILHYGPKNGYELKKIIDNSIGLMWTANLSQIYRDLSDLKKRKLIDSKIEMQNDKPNKKIYTITSQGKTEFSRWMHKFPEKLYQTQRDDFMLRIFLGKYLDTKKIIHELIRFHDQQKTALTGLTHFITGLKQSNMDQIDEKDKLYWLLTAKRVMKNLNADIEWANESISELKGDHYGSIQSNSNRKHRISKEIYNGRQNG